MPMEVEPACGAVWEALDKEVQYQGRYFYFLASIVSTVEI